MSRINSLVVTTDNFWIGGRETFLAANLGELKRREGAGVRLLATDARGVRADDLFDQVVEMGPRGEGEWSRWASRGKSEMRERPADLIWAQHYRLLPAWWLSRAFGVPLLATMHGPPTGVGRPDSAADALGIALAIHGGGVLSAVSEEVAASLVELGAVADRIRCIPNRVCVGGASSPPPAGPLRVLLLSREEKLGHLRAAVYLFHHLRRRAGRAELVVHTGRLGDERFPAAASPLRRASIAARRLGRRWLTRNPGLIGDLPWVHFASPTPDPAAAIRDAHVVLGMGRVVLEGVAARRPTVLVGYDRVVGLVNDERFREFQRRNFSGREAPVDDPQRVAADVVRALARPLPAHELLGAIDLELHWPETRSVLAEAMDEPREPDGSGRVALLGEVMANAKDERDVVRSTLAAASEPERNTFERLCNGKLAAADV